MGALVKNTRGQGALTFHDFDELGAALMEIDDERRADEAAALLPFSDEQTPYCGRRTTYFVGSPGMNVACPACRWDGGRVDDRGAFTCLNCGFYNTEERPLPRGRRRKKS